MRTREISIDQIEASMTNLRSARIDLAAAPKPHDSVTFKAHIDLCDELIKRVCDIDQTLRTLTSIGHRTPTNGARRQDTAADEQSPSNF
jgi:hypothetical protein